MLSGVPAADLVAHLFVRPGYILPTDTGLGGLGTFPGHHGPSLPPRGFAEMPDQQIVWLKELLGNSTKGLADNEE